MDSQFGEREIALGGKAECLFLKITGWSCTEISCLKNESGIRDGQERGRTVTLVGYHPWDKPYQLYFLSCLPLTVKGRPEQYQM